MKENKGITLIALVITIIVLLILAAISIATLTGENGILTKANNAKNNTIEGEEKEQIQLAYNAVLTEKMEIADNTLITAEELQKELDNLKAEATAKETNPIKVTYNKTGNTYKIDLSKGEISKVEVNPNMVSFSIKKDDEVASFEVEKGTTWEDFLRKNNKSPFNSIIYIWCYDKNTNQILLPLAENPSAEFYACYPLKDSAGEKVTKDEEIHMEEYLLDTIDTGEVDQVSFVDAIFF